MSSSVRPDLLRALTALTTGIYVVTVREGDERHGMSGSWVTQVSGDPPLLLAAVDRAHRTHGVIERTGTFALNVVGERGRHLEDYFHSAAAERADNLATVAYDDGTGGLPLLNGAMVSLECRVQQSHGVGDHTLFIATIERIVERGNDRPLTSQALDYVYVGTVVPQPTRD
ncbi:MAG TPA: flavin reductase family protein [Candidatus Binatia bacterium]|jgi:flavin reductase (DIM6/NTAB) family NADH-FMN oxidoreductase RutF|nr:flavin reductase family protein [Candidatus Binatia bacterium]